MAVDRVAFVTGAHKGVGKQVPRELVASGLTVYVGSRDLVRVRPRPEKWGWCGRGPARRDRLRVDRRGRQADRRGGRATRRAGQQRRNLAHGRRDGFTMEQYAAMSKPSSAPLNEMRAVWDVNVFGALAVHQAMLPLLRQSADARIVNVTSGLGSLTDAADPGNAYRAKFGPIYTGSKTALNALTLSMMIELEDTDINVNLVSPAFTATELNNFAGTESVEDGSREVVRVALLGSVRAKRHIHPLGRAGDPVVTALDLAQRYIAALECAPLSISRTVATFVSTASNRTLRKAMKRTNPGCWSRVGR